MRNFGKYRVTAQGKKKKSPFAYALYWVGTFAFSLWLTWILFSPGSGGRLGDTVATGFLYFLGKTAYLFPFIFLYGLVAMLLNVNKPHKGILTLTAGILLTLGALSTILELLSSRFGPWQSAGGMLGHLLDEISYKMFGGVGTGLFSTVILFAGLQLLFKISWQRLLKTVSGTIAADYREWSAARRELTARLKTISEKEAAGGTIYESKPIPEPPPEIKVQEKPAASSEPPPQHSALETTPAAKAAKPDAGRRPAPAAEKLTDPYFKGFLLPDTELLDKTPAQNSIAGPRDEETKAAAGRLVQTFKSFNVDVTINDTKGIGVHPGHVITRYDVEPAHGVKISSIVSLSNDVALRMESAGAIRVIAPIPGKSAIGFEIPNNTRATVYLRQLLDHPSFKSKKESLPPLTFVLGLDAQGAPALANLETMPHLLVAGATASGKSVFMQSLILSLIFHNTPDMLKFLFIDPKRLELTFYEGIQYLYDPTETPDRVSVITDPKLAAKSLVALTHVMEKRYKKFERAKVKNIASYNAWADENGEIREYYIVVVIDELADLMLQQKNVVEEAIQRLAQMARAVGIHLVLATQRPSVDVITGVIKANLPSRIALQVTSKTDSRVILDTPGAEALIGKGDLLYLAIDAQKPSRIQGAYVSEGEIRSVVRFLTGQEKFKPNYHPLAQDEEAQGSGKGSSSEEMIAALRLVMERKRVSQDLLKAHFGSSSRATNILSIMEMSGFIHKPEGSNRWEIYFDKIEAHLKTGELNSAQPVAAGTPIAPEEKPDL